ncbi:MULTISPECIES: acylphosphatase [Methylosinus]|uniref:acylphosphatase n=1 Tax=Methylosinus trichosporium (strain ATCC 35070 / NCIMB 11131 / UNIQEM 75 / OB3b) TaxID=595536 RepID=A0A2D2CWY6_METT3|nr:MULTISPECIES: acylphosphatase [Methylosinus]ATQ67258.1 acylphosphatase [Methylosinus trichosporium OB3b]OBS52576.1 acylphosphatase [Methylosinus sp. 3S-1]
MNFQDRRILRIIVEGRVQGVGFRAFVAREAGRLALEGWASNRRDGSVEIVAGGPAAAIEALVAAARRGPPAARVDALRCDDAEEAVLREGAGDIGFPPA